MHPFSFGPGRHRPYNTDMNQSQYEALEEQILDAFAALLHPVLRREGMRHTMRVIDMISLLHTDTPLWDRRTAALLHDTGKYLKNSPQHARTSAILCEQLLPEESGIAEAILHHSEKDRIHSPLAEDLKDADVLARWLDDPNRYQHPRLVTARNRLRAATIDSRRTEEQTD